MMHAARSFVITLLLLASSLSLAGAVEIDIKASAQQIEQERYLFRTVGDVNLFLWVYRLRQDREKANPELSPAIVLFHGGGWRTGSPRQFERQAKYFAGAGVVTILPEYRLTKKLGTPPIEALIDAKSAVRWARANAKRLGIDPKKLAAGGGSAGGHLAVGTAVVPGYDDPADDLNISSLPDALVLFNPALDIAGIWQQRFGTDVTSISPMQQLRKPIPPTIIFQGTEDTVTQYSVAQKFVQLALSAGSQHVKLVPFVGRTHGFFNSNKIGDLDATMNGTRSFFEEIGWLRAPQRANKND